MTRAEAANGKQTALRVAFRDLQELSDGVLAMQMPNAKYDTPKPAHYPAGPRRAQVCASTGSKTMTLRVPLRLT